MGRRAVKTKDKLVEHSIKVDEKSMNTSRLIFSCDICGINLESKVKIRNHVESHLNYSCDACKAVIKTRGLLLTHLSKHFKNFVCEICNQSFNYIEKFKRHVKKLHDPKTQEIKLNKEKFPCRFCPYVLNNKISLTAHEYRLHKDGKCEFQFVCEECGRGFYTREDYRLHGFEHYAGKILYCEFSGCDKFFRNSRLLRIHQQTHLPPRFECKECGARFVQGSGLLKHKKRFCKFQKSRNSSNSPEQLEKIAEIAKAQFNKLRLHKSRDERLKVVKILENIKEPAVETLIQVEIIENAEEAEECWIYEYLEEAEPTITDKNPVKLEGDSEKHEEISENSAPIVSKSRKVYNDGNPRKTNLIPRSNRTLHGNELYTCDFCGKGFRAWMSIYSHVTTVHKLLGDYKCEKCEKIFKTLGNLKRHVDSVHEKIFKFHCTICERGFTSKDKLQTHMKVHGDPEQCKVCGKFVRNLKEHRRRHEKTSNRTDVTCPTCGRLYDKHVLQLHIQRVHDKKSNGKIFRCDDCGMEFTRREDLRQHNYTNHFAGELHKCSKCDKVFNSKKLLRYHRMTHSPMTVNCEICEKTFSRPAGLYKHRKLKHSESSRADSQEIQFEDTLSQGVDVN